MSSALRVAPSCLRPTPMATAHHGRSISALGSSRRANATRTTRSFWPSPYMSDSADRPPTEEFSEISADSYEWCRGLLDVEQRPAEDFLVDRWRHNDMSRARVEVTPDLLQRIT